MFGRTGASAVARPPEQIARTTANATDAVLHMTDALQGDGFGWVLSPRASASAARSRGMGPTSGNIFRRAGGRQDNLSVAEIPVPRQNLPTLIVSGRRGISWTW